MKKGVSLEEAKLICYRKFYYEEKGVRAEEDRLADNEWI